MDDNSKNTILVIDDDKNILKILELYLVKEGFNVVTCEKGTQSLAAFHEAQPALVILDVMLPGKDGFAVLREIRQESAIPVIMLTAKSATFDRVEGLNAGADDYVSKPFDAQELIARIKAVLRRVPANEAETVSSISFGALNINLGNYSVTINNVQVDMAPKEIELLYFLASHENKVFTRDQLLEQIWGFDFYGDSRTIDVHVKRIREKLGDEYAPMLATVWGVGYKFKSHED